jgi:hypothetical protein
MTSSSVIGATFGTASSRECKYNVSLLIISQCAKCLVRDTNDIYVTGSYFSHRCIHAVLVQPIGKYVITDCSTVSREMPPQLTQSVDYVSIFLYLATRKSSTTVSLHGGDGTCVPMTISFNVDVMPWRGIESSITASLYPSLGSSSSLIKMYCFLP